MPLLRPVGARRVSRRSSSEYVRAGRVRIVFRGLSFIGPDSDTALRAALAAGEQDRLWDVVHGLFVQQGAENSGWVSDAVLRSFDGTGVDTQRMLDSHALAVGRAPARGRQQAAAAAGVRRRRSSRRAGQEPRWCPWRRALERRCLPARAGPLARGMSDRVLRSTPRGAFAGGRRRCGVCPRGPLDECWPALLDRWLRDGSALRLRRAPRRAGGWTRARSGTWSSGAAAARSRSTCTSTVAAAVALGAAVFSGYLLVVQLVVIDAVCDWCLASDAISSLIAVVALARLLAAGLRPCRSGQLGSSSPSASA